MRYTADTLISDILRADPDAAGIFARMGLHCPECLASGIESVRDAASMHEVPVDSLLDALNSATLDAEED